MGDTLCVCVCAWALASKEWLKKIKKKSLAFRLKMRQSKEPFQIFLFFFSPSIGNYIISKLQDDLILYTAHSRTSRINDVIMKRDSCTKITFCSTYKKNIKKTIRLTSKTKHHVKKKFL